MKTQAWFKLSEVVSAERRDADFGLPKESWQFLLIVGLKNGRVVQLNFSERAEADAAYEALVSKLEGK